MDIYVKHDFWGNCWLVMLRKGKQEWIIGNANTESLARQEAWRLHRVHLEAFEISVPVLD